MKCPYCNSKSAVFDTREERRKRQCQKGHKFETVEVTTDHLGWLEVQKRMAIARKTLKRLGYLK